LGHSVEVAFRFGEQLHELVGIAGDLVTTPWGESAVSWLYLKAAPVAEYRAGAGLDMRAVLVPARYVVGVDVGPTFQVTKYGPISDLAVFPPNQPTPAGALAMAEVARVLVELHAPGLN
jgi:hypothetical protein